MVIFSLMARALVLTSHYIVYIHTSVQLGELWTVLNASLIQQDRLLTVHCSGARARGEIYGPPCDKIGLTEKLGDAYTSSTGYLISCMSISVSNILSMNR